MIFQKRNHMFRHTNILIDIPQCKTCSTNFAKHNSLALTSLLLPVHFLPKYNKRKNRTKPSASPIPKYCCFQCSLAATGFSFAFMLGPPPPTTTTNNRKQGHFPSLVCLLAKSSIMQFWKRKKNTPGITCNCFISARFCFAWDSLTSHNGEKKIIWLKLILSS